VSSYGVCNLLVDLHFISVECNIVVHAVQLQALILMGLEPFLGPLLFLNCLIQLVYVVSRTP
jgi:hypothetical protein